MVVVQGEVTLVDFALKINLVFKWFKGTCCLSAGMGWDVVEEGLLCLVPFIDDADS